jgi:hypothetical protein
VAGDVFFVWTVPCHGDYVLDTLGTSIPEIKLNLHFGADCSAVRMEGNDDDNPSHVTLVGVFAGETYLIQTGGFAVATLEGDGMLNITRVPGGCSSVSIAPACDPANPHYQGGAVTLATSTFGSGVGSDLHLEAIDGPVDEFGFFPVSADGSGSASASDGVPCLVNPTARNNPQVVTNTGNAVLNSIAQFDAPETLEDDPGTSASGSGFDVPSQLPFTLGVQVISPDET